MNILCIKLKLLKVGQKPKSPKLLVLFPKRTSENNINNAEPKKNK